MIEYVTKCDFNNKRLSLSHLTPKGSFSRLINHAAQGYPGSGSASYPKQERRCWAFSLCILHSLFITAERRSLFQKPPANFSFTSFAKLDYMPNSTQARQLPG